MSASNSNGLGQTEPTSKQSMKTRSGDQPLPVANNLPIIQDLVLADLERRKQVGIQRYGNLLQAFNGRDVLQDIYEELLDAAVYMRQLIYERDNPDSRLEQVQDTTAQTPGSRS